MATTSYFQSLVICFTPATICLGVIFGPDGNFLGSFCPVARTLTLVPPTSTTSTFILKPLVLKRTQSAQISFSQRTAPQVLMACGLLEHVGLGRSHSHQLIPGIDE